jgi:lysophospholipase L1-like esterase
LNRLLNKEEEYHVFVGDSLIEQFPVEELYGCQKVLNRGIGQDTTMGLENRLERNINNIRIASCFIMIGRNDLKYRDAEETVERVDKLVKAIKARKKYFVSIPVGVKVEYAEGIMRVNNGIRERAKRGGFEYIDVSKEFVNTNGEIERELFYDDVHLTMSGYERISKILREYLLRLN